MSQVVAVTGSGGYIGRNLQAELRRAGWTVHPVPRALLSGSEVRSGVDIRAVVHLAADAGTGLDIEGSTDPEAELANAQLTQAALDMAKRTGAKHFILMSSVKAVGESTAPGAPFNSATIPEPQTWYGRSKLASEELVRETCTSNEITWTIIRSPMVYGSGGGRSLSLLARLATLPVPLPFSAVNNRRSFVHIANLVDFIRFSLEHRQGAEGIYYPSDGEAYSTPELLSLMANAKNRNAMLFGIPPSYLRAGFGALGLKAVSNRLLDSLEVDSSAALSLGWRPPLSKSDAIIGWLRNS